jgi:hypothetical protein
MRRQLLRIAEEYEWLADGIERARFGSWSAAQSANRCRIGNRVHVTILRQLALNNCPILVAELNTDAAPIVGWDEMSPTPELLIVAASWLLVFVLIAAIIGQAFR